MSVEMCRYLFRKGRRGWVRQRRVVNGKVRFRYAVTIDRARYDIRLGGDIIE